MHPDLLLGVNKLASPDGRMAVSATRTQRSPSLASLARSLARPRSCTHAHRRRPAPPPLPQALLRWYLSGWHFKTLGVKKPYNPIVGE